MNLRYDTLTFDDFTKDEHGTWSQVCKSCVDKLNIKHSILADTGSGICGIMGCNNESDFYIDFPEFLLLSEGTSVDSCAICTAPIEEIFSLCDSCCEKVSGWNQDTDTYIMKDNSRYVFNPKSGEYEKR